mgnify:FL=1
MSWQAVTGQSFWLLELQVAGAVHRFAEQAVTVDGFRYAAGLSSPTVGEASQSNQSVPIELVAQTDWAAIEAEGHTLERVPVKLKRYRQGQAHLWIDGLAMGCAYAEAGQPLTFDLSAEALAGDVEAIDPRQVIDATTHPNAGGSFELPDQSVGNLYALIFGCPGHDPSYVSPRPAVPSYLVIRDTTAGPPSSSDQMLIAGHRMHASTCEAWNLTTSSREQQALNLQADLIGQRYTGHQWLGSSIYTDSANSYAIGLQDDATYGGGMPSPYTPGRPLRNAGEVVRWILEQVPGLAVDRGRLDSYAPWLNRFKVDAFITGPIDWLDYLESAILAWLPVQTVNGPEGRYYAPVRWDLTRADVVAWIDADLREVQRVGSVKRLSQSVYNEITVNYRPRIGGGYYATRTVTAVDGQLQRGTTFGTDPRIRGDYLAKRSQTIYGVKPLVVSLDQTWDDGTADEVAHQLLWRHAWHKRMVTYEGGPELEALSVGDCVAVTESAVSLGQALARVVDIRPQRQTCSVDLVLLDNPIEANS